MIETRDNESALHRPRKLSLFFLNDHYPELQSLQARYEGLLELCIEADELGYEAVWLAEHHFSDFGTLPNPAVFLAAVAARTRRLRLGPAVSVLPFRHPMQVAEDYGMVDQLSSGRLNLGVGSGSLADEFWGFGLDPELKVERFDRSLPSLDAALRGLPGPDGGTCNVPPVGGRRPPFYVATGRAESARAAGVAGHGLLTLLSPGTRSTHQIVDRLTAHTEGLSSTEHPEPTRDHVVTLLGHLAETHGEARSQASPALDRFARTLGLGMGGEEVFDLMAESGTAAFGAPKDVLQKLQPLLSHGVDHLAIWTGFGGMDASHVKSSMRWAMGLTKSDPKTPARAA